MTNSSPSAASSSVRITYNSTAEFIDSPLCSHFLSCLSSHFPIRNLPYSIPSSSSSSTKTIQSLNVRLDPFADHLLNAKHKPETRHLVQANLLERPFAHIFIVATADSDAYRTHIRSDIRSWLNALKDTPSLNAFLRNSSSATEENSPITKDKDEEGMPEYLIVYVTPPAGYIPSVSTRSSSPGYFASPVATSSPVGTPGTPKTVENAAPTPKTGMGRFLTSSSSSSNKDPTGGVLEKLRTDFGGGKKAERIIHISRLPPLVIPGSLSTQSIDPAVFSDLLNSLKTSITGVLAASVKAQQEESNKLKALRKVRGWNPVGVFGKLECLGSTFESVGLFDEALASFEELDHLYKDCLREGELTFFPSITPTSLSQGEDSQSVLLPTAKPYRDMILHNGASLWDLKIYLLGRRLALLSKTGRGLAIMRETLHWISEMSLLVKDEDLPPHCLSAFIFSVCLDILHHCVLLFLSPSGILTTTVPATSIDGALLSAKDKLDQLPVTFHSASSDLLLLAVRQLEKIGAGFGYLAPVEPFVTGHELKKVVRTRELTGITKIELIQAVEDEEHFDAFYIKTAERTLDALVRGNRIRQQRDLRARLVGLEMQRGRLEDAYVAYTYLLEEHAEHSGKWNSLERVLLQRQLECHSKLGKPTDRQWVAAIVSLLRCMPSISVRPGDGGADNRFASGNAWDNEAALFELLRTASLAFEKEVPVSGFAKLAVAPASRRAVNLGNQDGSSLTVAVFSSLQCDLAVEGVRLCLSGGDSHHEEFWLTCGRTVLRPGRNEVILRTFACAPGRYVLDVSQIRFGRVIFQYVAPKNLSFGSPVASSSSSASPFDPLIITIPKDGQAIDVSLDQPRRIALDQPRNADLVLKTGRNIIQTATVRLTHAGDGRPFMGFGAADVLEDDPSLGIETTKDGLGIELTDLQPGREFTLRFPMDETPPPDGSAMPLIVDIEYLNPPTSSDDPKLVQPKRTFRKRVDLQTALPLGVNVQDFFKAESLLSKFSISTGNAGTLRLKGASLRHAEEEGTSAENGYKIIAPAVTRPTVVTPRQPAAFVFKLQRKHGALDSRVRGSPAVSSLRLTLTYRTLHEDAKFLILRILKDAMSPSSKSPLPIGTQILLEQTVSNMIDDRIDIPVYALTGSIRLSPKMNTRDWQGICESWGFGRTSTTTKRIIRIVQQVMEEAVRCGPEDTIDECKDGHVERYWRVLEIPVEVPRMDIVNRIALTLDTSKAATPYIVGKPIAVTISIKTTFAWGSHSSIKEVTTEDTSSIPASISLAPASLGVGTNGVPSAAASSVGDLETDGGSVFQDAASDVTATGDNKAVDDSSTCASGKAVKQCQRMCYEVQADFENWLVSGDKRAVWEAEVPSVGIPPSSAQARKGEEGEKRFQVTLIPLRSGSLTMPSVSVWPLPPGPKSISPSWAHRLPGQEEYRGRGEGVDRHGNLPSCESYVANVAERVEVYPSAGRGGSETFWIHEV